MSVLIAIGTFLACWFILHKLVIWYIARPKVAFKSASTYTDSSGIDTLDSRQGERE